MAQKIVKDRVESVKTQGRTIASFAKGTGGIFETLDSVTRQFRSTNRRMLGAAGLTRVRAKLPTFDNLRRRFRR